MNRNKKILSIVSLLIMFVAIFLPWYKVKYFDTRSIHGIEIQKYQLMVTIVFLGLVLHLFEYIYISYKKTNNKNGNIPNILSGIFGLILVSLLIGFLIKGTGLIYVLIAIPLIAFIWKVFLSVYTQSESERINGNNLLNPFILNLFRMLSVVLALSSVIISVLFFMQVLVPDEAKETFEIINDYGLYILVISSVLYSIINLTTLKGIKLNKVEMESFKQQVNNIRSNSKKREWNTQKNKIEQLQQLKELLDSGILSQKEFDEQKNQILK